MARIVTADPGEPVYELARAMWMVDQNATAKSFDRVGAMMKQFRILKARKIIANLSNLGLTVTDWKDVDGG